MGIDLQRFINYNDVSPEFMCSVCHDVLEDPVSITKCNHLFCRKCLVTWTQEKHTCPMDNIPMTWNEICPAPHYFKNLLGQLQVKCSYGCPESLKLQDENRHKVECKYNPKSIWECETCNEQVTGLTFKNHNCAEFLKNALFWKTMENQTLNDKLKRSHASAENAKSALLVEIEGLKEKVKKYESIIEKFKEFVKINDSANRALGAVEEELRTVEVLHTVDNAVLPIPVIASTHVRSLLHRDLPWDHFLIRK